MLSDSCFEFLSSVYEHGISDELYDELREAVVHYRKPPFSYPAQVCNPLLAAIDEVRKEDEPRISFVNLLGMVVATLQAYDSPSGTDLEERLPQTLRAIWPRCAEVMKPAERTARGPRLVQDAVSQT